MREIIWKIVLVAALTLSYVSCDSPARGLDNAEENNSNYSEQEQFIYPIREYLSITPYGWHREPDGAYKYYTGIDMHANTDTPVMASMNGIIAGVGNDLSNGNYIVINHDNSYQTFYANLSVVSVKTDQTVGKGQEIGRIGIGYNAGSCLHFSIYKEGRAIDPKNLLR